MALTETLVRSFDQAVEIKNWAGEKIRPITDSWPVGVTSVVIVTSGILIDAITRSRREFLPYPMSEHCGNFALSALPVMLFTLGGKLIEAEGNQRDNESLAKFGRNLQSGVIFAMACINAGVESLFFTYPMYFKECASDFSVGLLAIAVSRLATNFLIKLDPKFNKTSSLET